MTREVENRMILCSDCGSRAKGLTTLEPFDGTDECEWCGDEVSGSRTVVEEQEDPGPLAWQQDRNELAEWLDDHEHTDDVRQRDKVVDFTIGDVDEWPSYTGDSELNAIRSSSASLGFIRDKEERFQEVKIHIPPGPEELKDDVTDTLDLPEDFGVHYGTGALGGMPAPEGVITPHVVGKHVTLGQVKEVIQQCLSVYEDVYNEGEEVLKTKP